MNKFIVLPFLFILGYRLGFDKSCNEQQAENQINQARREQRQRQPILKI